MYEQGSSLIISTGVVTSKTFSNLILFLGYLRDCSIVALFPFQLFLLFFRWFLFPVLEERDAMGIAIYN